jgi:hypothetical protein
MPVYWKPRIPTRVMRERAWAERSLARERMLRAQAGHQVGWLARLRERLRRA